MGDAASTVVNRMSRHWSTGSSSESQQQQQAVPEALISDGPAGKSEESKSETISLPAVLSNLVGAGDSSSSPSSPRLLIRRAIEHGWRRLGSFSLSLDSTSARLRRQHSSMPNDNTKCEKIVSAGRQLMDTSVWTWGQGVTGQLGQSDCVSRDQPASVRHLQDIGVCKVACGGQHSLALTLDGRVFAWGTNSKGQIGPGEDLTFVSTPVEVSLPFSTAVRDIAAGK